MNSVKDQLESLSPQKRTLFEILMQEKDEPKSTIVQVIPHRQATEPIPLSFTQHRLWFLEQLIPHKSAYYIPIAIRLEGTLHVTALQQSFNEIIRRHAILRTSFMVIDEQPTQIIAQTHKRTIPLVDLGELSERELPIYMEQLRREEARRPFNLEQGPVIRATLLRFHHNEYILLITVHHIVFDMWSAGVFIREFATLYQSFLSEAPSPLPELSIQYADFAHWQRQRLQGETLETELAYWRRQLKDLPVLQLPIDRPYPSIQSFRGASQRFMLSTELAEQLRALSRQTGVTLFMTLLATFQVMVYRYTGQDDIIVGSPIANRNPSELEDLIGYFANTLVLRTSLAGNPQFIELLGRVRKVTLAAYAHQDLPFEKLVEELQPTRDLSRNPLIQVIFALQNAPIDALTLPEMQLSLIDTDNETTRLDLEFHLWETTESISGIVIYCADLFHAKTIERLIGHFQGLLSAVVCNPKQRLSELSLLTSRERHQLLIEWNDTQIDYAEDKCIQELFEVQVEYTPDAIALIYNEQQLTYRELNCRANQLAHYLQKSGIEPESLVGIYIDRSLEMMIGILAILKAGGAYVPLDPTYPEERLAFMLADAHISMLLTHQKFSANFTTSMHQTKHQIIYLDTDRPVFAKEDNNNLIRTSTPANLAYVIYTSGSTGTPKGVQISHGAVVNLLNAMQHRSLLTPQDILLSVASLSFDMSVVDIFLPLTVGSCLVLAQQIAVADGAQLGEQLIASKITVMQATPTTCRLLLDSGWHMAQKLKILCGGEALPYKLAQNLHSSGLSLWNMYGPTEATVWTTALPISDYDTAIIPIGFPLSNTQIYILDGHCDPVPVGIAGELYIGGAGLARGYLNRPGQTSERFVPNPFSKDPGARLYRTGDLARYLEDGRIEFLGRQDHQVKIRGFRVELDEIEATMSQHHAVLTAIALLRQGEASHDQLVAYVVPRESKVLEIGDLRQFLHTKLPSYMVPSIFIQLKTLPLSPNGKVDYKALPKPERDQIEISTNFVAPRTPIEEILVSIWADALGVTSIGIHDNFFELGGHSLLTTQIVFRVNRALQIELPLHHLFESPTIAELAAIIERQQHAQLDIPYPSIPVLDIVPDFEQRHQPFPLTNVQQAYWLGRNIAFELGNVASHIYMETDFIGLDCERLNSALRRLIDRHDMLRAIILPDGQQKILEQVPSYQIAVFDLRSFDSRRVEAELEAVRQRMSHQILPSNQWPLFEICVSQMDDQRVRIHTSFDLLFVDATSLQILVQQLNQLYQEPKSTLAPLALSFRDYVIAEIALRESALFQQSRTYWQERMISLPPAPELPLMKNPSTLTEPRFMRRNASLDPKIWQSLKRRAGRAGLTASSILLAAFAEVLSVWSKNPQFTINLTLFNRLPLHPQVNELIGDFTSLTLLAVNNLRSDRFEERAKRLHKQLLLDLDHRYFSGVEVLRELVQMQGGASRASMPVVFTSLINQDALAAEQDHDSLDLLSGKSVHTITQTPQVWLDCQVADQAGVLSLNWDTVEELFPEGLLDEMFNAYCGFLNRLATEDAAWKEVSPLIIPLAQLEQRTAINATQAPRSDEMLHTLFAKQVLQRPRQLALISDGFSLTYNELYRRSNQIGYHLRQWKAGPNQLVAVIMKKGWEQVVAVLAILQSGAAYLPIEPELPKERLWYLLEHGEVKIALTQSVVNDALEWPETIQRFCVDSEDWTDVDDQALKPLQKQQDLAYVIFTSGSTGLPKGVMIDHCGAVNTIVDLNQRFNITPKDRVFALSSLSFDLSVYDIFGTLAAGGTIIIPSASSVRDPAHWFELLIREKVTIWNSVPALMKMLVEYLMTHSLQLPQSLRLVFLSGDWIPLTLPEQIKALTKKIEVISLGGATEASIWSILYPISTIDPEWKSIPYGQPMQNQWFHVLNETLDPCPVWVTGQLYIGGIGLAKGYWRNEDKTKASFITHPRTGERLYRTGDLGRYLPDGNIEFLGREDFQVKVNGYRIELGEIETALLQLDKVRTAVVAAVGEQQGNKRLVAYYVPEQEAALTTDELRRFLKEKLPTYMIPAHFIPVDALPLTSNGKIDRKALLAIDGLDRTQDFTTPRTPLEETLGEVWMQILGVDRISIYENFFELGGSSILAIQLITKLQEVLKVKIPLGDLFDQPTVRGLAAAIEEARSKAIGVENRSAPLPMIVPDLQHMDQPFPLTDVQMAYWVGRSGAIELGNVGTHSYVEVDVTDLDLERLNFAIQTLIMRHQMLRIIVHPNGQQQILKEVPLFHVTCNDLRGQESQVVHAQLDATRQAMSHQMFKTDQWPLFEIRAHLLDEQCTRLHISFDLLIADARSFQLILEELFQLYQNPDVSFAPLDLSFRDYVLAINDLQDSEIYLSARDYWVRRASTIPPAPELPYVKHPSTLPQPRFSRYSSELNAETWKQLKSKAGQIGLTPSGVLCAAFAETLALWSRSPRFTINLTTFNRLPLHPQVDKLVGDFTSTTLLEVDWTSGSTFQANARHLQEQIWNDLEYRMFSGIQMLRELRRSARNTQINMPVVFTSTLIYDKQDRQNQQEPWQGEIIYSISQTSQVLLDHQIFERAGVLQFNWDIVEEVFPEGLIPDMFETYCRFLSCLASEEGIWQAV